MSIPDVPEARVPVGLVDLPGVHLPAPQVVGVVEGKGGDCLEGGAEEEVDGIFCGFNFVISLADHPSVHLPALQLMMMIN